MQNPIVSVIIPAFNSGLFIEQTVQSVLCQSFRRIEVIVVDDSSSDNTESAVARIAAGEPRLLYTKLSINSGTPAVPRNHGVCLSKGQWISFLDADDLWHPDKLAIQLRAVSESKTWLCSTEMRDFRFAVPHVSVAAIPKVDRVSLRGQLAKYRTPTSSMLVERSVLEKLPFPEDLRLRGREDLAWSLKAHDRFGDSIKIREALVFYRKHAGQISTHKWKMYRRVGLVLHEFRFSDGRKLGTARKWWFMFLYAFFSLWMRGVARRL